jgi:hypothetical protein
LLGGVLAIPLTGVGKSLAEILLEPTLPPQTGSFFHNPLEGDIISPALKVDSSANAIDEADFQSSDGTPSRE